MEADFVTTSEDTILIRLNDGYERFEEIILDTFGNDINMNPSIELNNSEDLDDPIYDNLQYIYLRNVGIVILTSKNKNKITALKSHPGVKSVNYDKLISIKKLNPDFDSTPNNWGIKRMNLENTKKTGKGVKVAILDTGIDLEHAGFTGLIQKDRTCNFIKAGESVQDKCGHGTHVAGILCGRPFKSMDFKYGVAPDIDLFIGKVLDDDNDIYTK